MHSLREHRAWDKFHLGRAANSMPSEGRHVKEGRGKKRAMVPHREHVSSKKDDHCLVIVNCPR